MQAGIELFLATFNDESAKIKELLTRLKPVTAQPEQPSATLNPPSYVTTQKSPRLNRDDLRAKIVTELFKAAYHSDLIALQKFIDEKYYLYERDSETGKSVLHYAAIHNRSDSVTLLLNGDFDGNMEDLGTMCRTPLHDAALGGCLEAVRALLAHKDTVVDKKDATGHTALHYAAIGNHPEIAHLLCQSNASTLLGNDAHATSGKNALQLAVGHSNIEVMLAIVESIDEEDVAGRMADALQQIASHHALAILFTQEVALTTANVIDSEGFLNLQYKPTLRALLMLKAILDHPATNPDDRYELNEGRKSTDENSVLHLAAYHGKTTAVHVFCRLFELKREHYVTTVDDQNSAADTALHVAAFTGNGTTASALLSHGADPALLNDKDQSPLHRAAKADQVACANALLQSSSSCESTTHGLLTLRDHKDQTPFFTAARHFNTNILSTLYDATIINEKDSEGDTALHAILTEIDTLDPKDYKSAEDIEFLIRQLKSAEQTIQFLCDNGALVDINNDSDLTAEQIVLESSYDSMDPAKNIFSFTCQIGEQPYQCQIYTTITSAAKRLRETNKVASTETSAQDQETFEQMMNAIANLTPQDPVDEEIITPVEHQTAQTENFFIDSNTETLIEEKTNMLAASAFEIQAEEKNRLVKSAIENQTDQEGNTLDKTTMEHITAEDERTLSEATATNQIIQEAIFPLELTIENQTEEEKTIAQLGSDNLIEEEVNKLVESAFSVESEDEDTSPAKSTSSETPGNTRASLRLSLDRLPMMPAQTASPLSPNMAHDSDLSRFVRLLEELSSLDDISDIDDLRTADGHNVLHLIASEPDFSHYEAVLIKHRGHKLFGTLLTLTTDNNLAPLHSIVLAHNVAMLDCILASNNPSLPELLCYTGEVRTKPSGSNVFHCIGNSHGNERAHQVKKIFTSHLDPSTYPRNYAASEKIGQSVYPMLSALVDLYGKEQSAYLAAQGDQDNCTLLTLACFTCNPDFVLACAEVCSYHDPEQKIVNSSAFFSAPTKSVDYSVYSLLSPMKLTGMTAPQILSLLGSAECLQILFKLNASATRIGCEKRCDFFDTESALDLACIAPCPSKAECLDFITVCSQISCSLGDSLNQFISNYSEAAQTVFEFIKMVDDFNMFDVTASTQVVIDSFNEQHSEDSNFTVS